MRISELQCVVHDIAKEKGWWDTDRTGAECIALMHSELSEALEVTREGNPLSKKIPPISHVEEELADCIIRILDYAEKQGYDMEAALQDKIKYNATRSYRHGNKEF